MQFNPMKKPRGSFSQLPLGFFILMYLLKELYIFNLPVDRFFSGSYQKIISLGKRSAAEKTSMCGKRAGMNGFNDKVVWIIDNT
jgi:hypothetical protein